MGVLFEKLCYGLEILVQNPGYSVLAIEKNCICGFLYCHVAQDV